MAADPLTRDIKTPRFFCRHRVLLEKCSPGVCIVLKHACDLERTDLALSLLSWVLKPT